MSYENIPGSVENKLKELALELAEGDITIQGFEKKRKKLLEPYIAIDSDNSNIQDIPSFSQDFIDLKPHNDDEEKLNPKAIGVQSFNPLSPHQNNRTIGLKENEIKRKLTKTEPSDGPTSLPTTTYIDDDNSLKSGHSILDEPDITYDKQEETKVSSAVLTKVDSETVIADLVNPDSSLIGIIQPSPIDSLYPNSDTFASEDISNKIFHFQDKSAVSGFTIPSATGTSDSNHDLSVNGETTSSSRGSSDVWESSNNASNINIVAGSSEIIPITTIEKTKATPEIQSTNTLLYGKQNIVQIDEMEKLKRFDSVKSGTKSTANATPIGKSFLDNDSSNENISEAINSKEAEGSISDIEAIESELVSPQLDNESISQEFGSNNNFNPNEYHVPDQQWQGENERLLAIEGSIANDLEFPAITQLDDLAEDRTRRKIHKAKSQPPEKELDIYLFPELTIHSQSLPTIPRPHSLLSLDKKLAENMYTYSSIANILQVRAQNMSKEIAFSIIDSKGKVQNSITWEKLHARARKISIALTEKYMVKPGDFIALLYKKSEALEFVVALFACFYAKCIATPIVTTGNTLQLEISEISTIINSAKLSIALTTENNIRLLSKETKGSEISKLEWIRTPDMGTYTKKDTYSVPKMLGDSPSFADFYSFDNKGEGSVFNNKAIIEQCQILKDAYWIRQDGGIYSFLDFRYGFGLTSSILLPVYAGCPVYINCDEQLNIPGAFLQSLQKNDISICFGHELGYAEAIASLSAYKPSKKSIPSLKGVDTLVVYGNSQYDDLSEYIYQHLRSYGLASKGCISRAFPNPYLLGMPLTTLDHFDYHNERNEFNTNTTGASGQFVTATIEAVHNSIYISALSLREGNIKILSVGNEPSNSLHDSYRLGEVGCATLTTSIAIVNNNGVLLPNNTVGEIWVDTSSFGPYRYHNATPEILKNIELQPKLAKSVPINSKPTMIYEPIIGRYIRTGLYGFLLEQKDIATFVHPRLFVVGTNDNRLFQKTTGYIETGLTDLLPTYFQYFSGEIKAYILKTIPTIICLSVFQTVVKGDFVHVVALETMAQDSDYPNLSKLIMNSVKHKFGFHIYSVVICQGGSLPRSSPVPDTGTHIQRTNIETSYRNVDATVLFSSAGGSLPELIVGSSSLPNSALTTSLTPHSTFTTAQYNHVIKCIEIDEEKTKHRFVEGKLETIDIFFNCSTNTITTRESYNRINDLELQKLLTDFTSIWQVMGGIDIQPLLDNKTKYDLSTFPTILHTLEWRGREFKSEKQLTVLDHRGKDLKTITFGKFSNRVQSIATYITKKKGIKPRDIVLLIFNNSYEFYYTLWACLYAGIVPIPYCTPDIARLSDDVPVLVEVIDFFGIQNVLSTGSSLEVLKNKQTINIVKGIRANQNRDKSSRKNIFPNIIDSNKYSKLKTSCAVDDPLFFHGKKIAPATSGSFEDCALINVHISSDAPLTYTYLSHKSILDRCRILIQENGWLQSCPQKRIKVTADPSPFLSCESPYEGIGLLYSTFLGVYTGISTLVIQPFDYYLNPILWHESIYKYRITDTYTNYRQLVHSLRTLKTQDFRQVSYHNLRNLSILYSGRSNYLLNKTIASTLKAFRFNPRALSPMYTNIFNPLIASRAYSECTVLSLFLDANELKKNKVKVLHQSRTRSAATVLDSVRHSAAVPLDTSMASIAQASHHSALQQEAGFGFESSFPMLINKNGEEIPVVIVQDSGQIPNNTVVVIMDPVTLKPCAPYQVGDIWVASLGNAEGFGIVEVGESISNLKPNPVGQPIDGFDKSLKFIRTGDSGFLWPSAVDDSHLSGIDDLYTSPQNDDGNHSKRISAISRSGMQEGLSLQSLNKGEIGMSIQGFSSNLNGSILTVNFDETIVEDLFGGWSGMLKHGSKTNMVLFVVGSDFSKFVVDGMTFYNEDIEKTIENSHDSLVDEGTCVFSSEGGHAVAICETNQDSRFLASLVPIIIQNVLEIHGFVIGTVGFLPRGTLARDISGNRQRNKVRLAYMSGSLPTIQTISIL